MDQRLESHNFVFIIAFDNSIGYNALIDYNAPKQQESNLSLFVENLVQADPSSLRTGNAKYPDVYYIVLDTHGRTDTIKNELGYDNSELIKPLSDIGFYIASCSNANYPSATWQSMAATLNLSYFDHSIIKEQNPKNTTALSKVSIRKSFVIGEFRRMGYSIVNFNSMWDFLIMDDADYFYDFSFFSGSEIKMPNRYESYLLSMTPINNASLPQLFSTDRAHYNNILGVLSKLKQIPIEISSPKFVYAHLMIPHTPYVFSADGEFISKSNSEDYSKDGYIDQVMFIDKAIVSVIGEIIKNSPEPPIIIIQGDHGLPSNKPNNVSGILNAYYLPGSVSKQSLYPTITPVNTFRIIFNLYFGDAYQILPDEIYFDNFRSDNEHKEKGIPYDFIYYGKSTCGEE